jgi:4-hydroxybenzoate polyprenyltransferase
MIKEYLKLARSFNAGLTSLAPVLGAVAMQQFNLFNLFLLFLIGFFGHSYGFALNDILDLKIDQTSKEIKDRPLINKKITIRNARIFVISCAIISFLLAIYLSWKTNHYFPFIILVLSSVSITTYDLISKKYPGMDIFVAGSIFLLILYGSSTVSLNITPLAWVVCTLGTIQVFFMQFIAGGLKDIENDFKMGAKTLAVKMGVRVENGLVKMPNSFKILAYSLQLTELVLLFVPFFLIFSPLRLFHYILFVALILFSLLMLFISYKLLNMKYFERNKARKLIGSHFQINYILVPIMLMALTPWSIFLAVISPLIFVLSNVVLHGTLLQPKTM